MASVGRSYSHRLLWSHFPEASIGAFDRLRGGEASECAGGLRPSPAYREAGSHD